MFFNFLLVPGQVAHQPSRKIAVELGNLLGASRRRRRFQLATPLWSHSSSPYHWFHSRRRTQRHYLNTCIRSRSSPSMQTLCLNANAKCCPELFAGLDQPQPLPIGERAGRCGHWLQRDEVLAFWREYLRVTVILKKLQRNTTAISGQRECRMFVESSEASVKVEVAERRIKPVKGFILTGGDSTVVDHQFAHGRQLQAPLVAGLGGNPKIGMESETQRQQILRQDCCLDRQAIRA